MPKPSEGLWEWVTESRGLEVRVVRIKTVKQRVAVIQPSVCISLVIEGVASQNALVNVREVAEEILSK